MIVNKWSSVIAFNDLNKSKSTSEVFIEIDISLMPRKRRIDIDEEFEKIQCSELFNKIEQHCVILGQPGAGKTTLTKYLCQSVLQDENFYPRDFNIPILIRLRELNAFSGETSVIIDHLFDLLGLVLEKDKTDSIIKESDFLLAKKRILIPILNSIKPLIVLDGFDELSTQKLKQKVLAEFKELCFSLQSGRIVFTSRSSDYNFSFENTAVLEVAPLNEVQISTFVNKWLIDNQKVNDFLTTLYQSPFVDASIRPLTLSHLCAIYERSGKIPEKPKTIYKKIVNLLLEEWDEQREVRRLTEYGNFETDRKFEFLSRIAYEITTQYRVTVFSEEQLKKIYYDIFIDFNLPKAEALKITRELEGHTGLILQSGYSSFEFAHKSIHEFLCAEHLVKLPTIPKKYEILSLLPNELAVATSISSNPSEYFCELVFNRLAFDINRPNYNKYYSRDFISTFINRLLIEKPDFNFSRNISFALVVLYTLLRKNERGQLRLFEADITKQYEKFVEFVYLRNKIFDYTSYYTLHNTHESEDKEAILELRLTAKGQSYTDLEFRLPETIFARKSFVVGF